MNVVKSSLSIYTLKYEVYIYDTMYLWIFHVFFGITILISHVIILRIAFPFSLT